MTTPLDLLVVVTAASDDRVVQEAADIALTAAAFEQRTGFVSVDDVAVAAETRALLRDTGVDPLHVGMGPGELPALVATSRQVIALP